MQTSSTSMHTVEGKRARTRTHNNKVSDENIIIIKTSNYPPNRPQIGTET